MSREGRGNGCERKGDCSQAKSSVRGRATSGVSDWGMCCSERQAGGEHRADIQSKSRHRDTAGTTHNIVIYQWMLSVILVECYALWASGSEPTCTAHTKLELTYNITVCTVPESPRNINPLRQLAGLTPVSPISMVTCRNNQNQGRRQVGAWGCCPQIFKC